MLAASDLCIAYDIPSDKAIAEVLSVRLGLPLVPLREATTPLALVVSNDHVRLQALDQPVPYSIDVDFISGALAHRRQFGGGRGQLIAKAIGFKKNPHPTVLDLTAGLGRDAFVLATLGAKVTMVERAALVVVLLEDGLRRAQQAAWFRALSLTLVEADAMTYLDHLDPMAYPDVIYCDPMFPASNKTAQVKKEMQLLRRVIGKDSGAENLLAAARGIAKQRVVVKRARLAPALSADKPDIVFEGKSSRYDVYMTRR